VCIGWTFSRPYHRCYQSRLSAVKFEAFLFFSFAPTVTLAVDLN
jgi:hypothetical protein